MGEVFRAKDTRLCRAACLSDFPGAIAMGQKQPEDAYRLFASAIVHRAMGDGKECGVALQFLICEHAKGAVFQIAGVYGALGDTDRAIEGLERAYAQKDSGLTSVKIDTPLRSLRGDPRRSAFLEKMGLA